MSLTFKKTKIWDNNRYDEIIDVRSPGEYFEDHIVGSTNLPVLYDYEREIVGKIYKNISPFKAKILASSLITKNVSKHINTHFSSKNGSWRPLIYCWRGGQRSKALSIILSQIGWRTTQLEGGYKFYRKEIINKIDKMSQKLNIVLISGKTGTGKTQIIKKLIENGAQAIDLEDLANHKGSLLGRNIDKNQPTQKYFESLIYSKLIEFNFKKKVYIEAESSKIGQLHIPKELWKNMLSSKKIQIKTPIHNRIKFLLNDYDYMISNDSLFQPLLTGLEQKISKNLINEWKKYIKNKEWEKLVKSLLDNHYDPSYKNNFDEKKQKLMKTINLDCIDEKNLIDTAKQILKH